MCWSFKLWAVCLVGCEWSRRFSLSAYADRVCAPSASRPPSQDRLLQESACFRTCPLSGLEVQRAGSFSFCFFLLSPTSLRPSRSTSPLKGLRVIDLALLQRSELVSALHYGSLPLRLLCERVTSSRRA